MFYRSPSFWPIVLSWLVLLLVTSLSLAAADARAQGAEQATLKEAFAAGDARAVLEPAAGRVEVGVFGSSSQYSRSQAIYVLQKFFDNHPPRRFAWESTSINGQSRFLTGRYWHESSSGPLSVYLRLSKSGGGWQLQEVRVERP